MRGPPSAAVLLRMVLASMVLASTVLASTVLATARLASARTATAGGLAAPILDMTRITKPITTASTTPTTQWLTIRARTTGRPTSPITRLAHTVLAALTVLAGMAPASMAPGTTFPVPATIGPASTVREITPLATTAPEITARATTTPATTVVATTAQAATA